MRAVLFDVSVPHFLAARGLGRISRAALYRPWTGVGLADVSLPRLPGPDWVHLRVLSCGVCGSDVGNLSFVSSPAMEPFGSFPAVPGHEILAVVEERGAGVRDLELGQRVVVDPLISCAVRGYAPETTCRSCRSGSHATCEHAGEEGRIDVGAHRLAPGLTVGYHRDLPGGWGERIIAHRSQLWPVPDALDDRTAGLIEPLAIGMRAVLRAGPPQGSRDPVLVIGSGPIAFATVWALRATGFAGPLFAQAKRTNEATMHRKLGASETIAPGPEAREALVGTGAMAYQPLVGPEVYSGGGFPLIYDCVGSPASLSQALRYASPRGRVVLLGCAGETRRLDLTFLWARELDVLGFVGYGAESWRGETKHTFQIVIDGLVEGGAPVGDMVTHVFPLEEYRAALLAASDRRRSGAIKVTLKPE